MLGIWLKIENNIKLDNKYKHLLLESIINTENLKYFKMMSYNKRSFPSTLNGFIIIKINFNFLKTLKMDIHSVEEDMCFSIGDINVGIDKRKILVVSENHGRNIACML